MEPAASRERRRAGASGAGIGTGSWRGPPAARSWPPGGRPEPLPRSAVRPSGRYPGRGVAARPWSGPSGPWPPGPGPRPPRPVAATARSVGGVSRRGSRPEPRRPQGRSRPSNRPRRGRSARWTSPRQRGCRRPGRPRGPTHSRLRTRGGSGDRAEAGGPLPASLHAAAGHRPADPGRRSWAVTVRRPVAAPPGRRPPVRRLVRRSGRRRSWPDRPRSHRTWRRSPRRPRPAPRR